MGLHDKDCKWQIDGCKHLPGCKSLYVLTPMYGGQLTVNYHHSFVQLVAACQEVSVEIGSNNIYNESLISRARNRLVDAYLKETNYTHSVFIDADIGFDARDILAMLEMDKPILGVPCSKKSIRWDRIQFAIAKRVLDWSQGKTSEPAALAQEFLQTGAFNPNELPRIGGDFVLNFDIGETKNIDLMTPEPMRHVGTGLLMVRREVYEKFMRVYPNRWYESKDPTCLPGHIHDFFKVGVNEETREYLSEDYWFIHDCIAMGYKALLCPWIKTTHMGTFKFVGDMHAALETTGSIF